MSYDWRSTQTTDRHPYRDYNFIYIDIMHFLLCIVYICCRDYFLLIVHKWCFPILLDLILMVSAVCNGYLVYRRLNGANVNIKSRKNSYVNIYIQW